MILDLDVGNTRIKWRLQTGDNSTLLRGAVGVKAGDGSDGIAELVAQVVNAAAGKCSRVRISSVRDAVFNKALEAALQGGLHVNPEFAAVSRSCCGVTNSYDDYSRMGVDRWLAMIAAFQRARGGCAVLDLGSAITFDVVNQAGEHQGGYIVPGFQLMLCSLTGKSSALNVNPAERQQPGPGKNTEEAIGDGLLAMVLGFASRCRQETGVRPEDTTWFLTGGDAGRLSPHIAWEHRVVPDLVLEGLAHVLS